MDARHRTGGPDLEADASSRVRRNWADRISGLAGTSCWLTFRPSGAAGTAGTGMLAPGESVSVLKLVSIGLIVAGVAGLDLSGVTP